MVRCALVLALTLGCALIATPVSAQNGTVFPPGGIPGPITFPPAPPIDCAQLDGNDLSAVAGTAFSVALEITNVNPIGMLSLWIQNDPGRLTTTGWTQGPALQDFITANGPLPCDVSVAPDGIFLTMFFFMPFDPGVYGTDLLSVQYTAGATTGPTSILLMDNCTGQMPGEIVVTLLAPGTNQLARGDVDASGTCNVADAVKILSYLFTPNAVPVSCEDAADIDDNGSMDIGDAIALLQGLFGLGPAPTEICEFDLTSDSLGCAQSGCP